MALPYPNPSMSEMAEEDLRDGSVGSGETLPQAKQHTPRKMALRQILLTIMCEGLFFPSPPSGAPGAR